MKKACCIRLKYTFFSFLGLLLASAAAAYFEYTCRKLIIIPKLPYALWKNLIVVEVFAWITVFLVLTCVIGVLFRRACWPFGAAFQLFLVSSALGIATWSLAGLESKHHRHNTVMRFALAKNFTDDRYLELNYEPWGQRYSNVNFYRYLDQIQKDFSCCGLKGPTDWDTKTVQDWLHTDLTKSCNAPNQYITLENKECAPVLPNGTDFPASCCESNASPQGCDKSQRHSKGCTEHLEAPLKPCLAHSPILFIVSFVLAIYMTLVGYMHARAVQNRKCCYKCCCYNACKEKNPDDDLSFSRGGRTPSVFNSEKLVSKILLNLEQHKQEKLERLASIHVSKELEVLKSLKK